MQRLGFEYPKKRKAAFSSSEEAELIRGLVLHKECVGHTLVTPTFDPRSVDGWTQEDLPLGKLVKKARKLYKTKELDEGMIERLAVHGMVWNLSAFKTKVLPALQTYKKLKGNLEVPTDFKVPHDDPQWPRASWGGALGNQVSQLRNGKSMKLDDEDKKSLEDLGFSIESASTKRWNSVVFPALCQYWQENGTAQISQKFKIPATGDWPAKWHGLALGDT